MQTEARIYLAGQRGITQNTWYRSYHTFNFKNYQSEDRLPFGMLRTLNDDTLSGEQTITYEIEAGDMLMLLPIVGGIQVKENGGVEKFVEAGEADFVSASNRSCISITNPYSQLINYLYIQFHFDIPVRSSSKFSIDLDANKNNLICYHLVDERQANKITIHIGKYTGRSEGRILMGNTSNGQFAFVIEGAFEVQDRLLHARDGLALWNAEEVEFEALSNDAIILFVEQH